MSTRRRLAEDDTVVPTDAVTAHPGGAPATHVLGRGTVVSRYVILHRVGSGGMGVVYAAYDPQLDRRVAVKVLSAERSMDTQGRHRMLREAQAMARLTHPNVVAVHDVGVHDDRTFIAMEYVEGQTIKAWLAAAPRPWREVLRVYTAAARGLVAAHAVDLVHRDFKPDNVMLATDPREPSAVGRVLVMDFGLARPLRTLDGDADPSAPTRPGVTHTGTFAGTPAYMAPEQFAGEAVGPWSDQFSFCIALYEGLFGERPFLGDTVSALAASVTLGKTQAPTLRSGVPWHLRQAVLRGLSPDPAARHASMTDLLAVLERDPSRARRNLVAFSVATCTLAGSFAVGSLFDPAQRRCDRGAATIDEVWSEARRTRIGEAFVAAGVPLPEVRWRELEPLLDARAEQWRAAFADACAATHVRGEQSGERLDARMRCLQDRRERFDALVGELETVDAELATRALSATLSLPSIEVCADPDDGEFVARAREFDRAEAGTEDADRLLAAERALALAKARNDAGRYPQGIAATTDALAELGDRDVPWLRGEILAVRAQLQHRAGESVAAEQTARDALRVAVPAGQHDVAARAWFELIYIVGAELARPTEALALQLSAELELAAVGENPAMRRKLEGVLASVYQADAQLERALEHHEVAIALAQGTDVPPLTRVIVHSNYGNTLYDLGRYAAALDAHQRAFDLAIATVGDSHPMVAIDMMSVARDLERLGEVERARGLYQRSIALREAALGPDARGVGESLLNLAVLEFGQLEFDAAREHGLRALEIFRHVLGPDHPHVAAAYNHLGSIAHAQGDLDAAMRDFDEVARIYEVRFGPTYPKLAVAHKNRGNVLLDRGEYERAIELYDRALEIDVTRLGPEHPSLAFEYVGKARALVALDRAAEAVPLAERAVALREGVTADAGDLTVGYFALAQALWNSPESDEPSRQRALGFGRRALVEWRNSGLDDPERLAMYETWLRERGGDTGLAEG